MRAVHITVAISSLVLANLGCGARTDPLGPGESDDPGGNQTPGLGIPCSEVDPKGSVRWIQVAATATDLYLDDEPEPIGLYIGDDGRVTFAWRYDREATFAGSKLPAGTWISRLGPDGCLESTTDGRVPLDFTSSLPTLRGTDAFVLDGRRIVVGSNGAVLWESEELFGFNLDVAPSVVVRDQVFFAAGCSTNSLCGEWSNEASLVVGSLRTDDGSVRWSRTFSAIGKSPNQVGAFATSLAVDPLGNLAVGGRYTGTLRLDEFTFESTHQKYGFLARLDGTGGLRWAKDLPTDGEIATDAAGDVYQMERPCAADASEFGLVKRSGETGGIEWSSCSGRPRPASYSNIDRASLAVFPDGFSIMVASFQKDIGFLPAGVDPPNRPNAGLLLVAHDALGNHVGSKVLGLALEHAGLTDSPDDDEGIIRDLIARPAPNGDLVLVGTLDGGLHGGDVEIAQTFAAFVMRVGRDGWSSLPQ